MLLSLPKPIFLLSLIILASLAIFYPAFSVFFSADDFYNMRLVMNASLIDVLKSFFFEPRSDFLFYRPLTTQFYFFLTKPIFSFNPVGYHFISFSLFIGIILLVYKLALILTKRKDIAFLTSFFYVFSSSNLTRLSWIVQVQELALGFFVFLGIFLFVTHQGKKKSNLFIVSIICFILALMSKESAVIFPFLTLLAALSRTKPLIKGLSWEKMRPLIPFFIVLTVYLYLRLVKMGISTGEHYFTSSSPRAILNTLFWYTMWGIGIPEELVNFDLFGPGLSINQQLINLFISDIPLVGLGVFLFFTLLIIMLFWGFIEFLRRMKRIGEEKKVLGKIALFGISWFILALIPHLFSPWHKFAYELTVPLFGLSLGIATIVIFFLQCDPLGKNRRFPYRARFLVLVFLLTSYLLLSLSTVKFEKNTHWVFKRGRIAQKVFYYLQKYYSGLPIESKVVFINDKKDSGEVYGLSKQIFLALSGKVALQLFYMNPDMEVYYQDMDDLSGLEKEKAIIIPSSQFL